MRIAEIQIHNYRSIEDEKILLQDYSLLIGTNNSGKSNIIDAVRVFYEKDLKFDAGKDLPKFRRKDDESWIEIEYEMTSEEAATIKNEYLIKGKSFRIRKWFHPTEKAKKGIFGYENGKLSENLFYGWENVGKAKLGSVIFIPAVSHLEEHTKLTGPSALRDLVNDILKPLIKSSQAFADLSKHFSSFGSGIKTEQTADKRSLSGLESKINEQLSSWGAEFSFSVDSPKEEDIIKNLISHSVKDLELGQELSPSSFGHGFQRHLIYSLIRIAATYIAPKPAAKKKEFAPDLDLLLYEEPEAFLHPPQQDILDTSLREIASQPGKQVLIATHSPLFVSFNTDDISDLVKVCKLTGRTQINQLSRKELQSIFEEDQKVKKIVEGKQGEEAEQEKAAAEMELEAVRHFLWLNPERCGLLFADMVLIVEGLSDQILIHYLIKTSQIATGQRWVFVLDVLGKYNIARFMNLLGALKIRHAVLWDQDSAAKGDAMTIQKELNALIEGSKNDCTVRLDTVPSNLETELGLKIDKGDRWKASKILMAAMKGQIDQGKLAAFNRKIEALLSD